jgi:hypothetical protein
VITVSDSFQGEKTLTVDCPPGDLAVGGGFADLNGSVDSSYRSDSSGNPLGNTSWTVIKTSGSTAGTAYAYCAKVG